MGSPTLGIATLGTYVRKPMERFLGFKFHLCGSKTDVISSAILCPNNCSVGRCRVVVKGPRWKAEERGFKSQATYNDLVHNVRLITGTHC